MPKLTATNTLYVVRFKQPASATLRAAVGIALLTSLAQRGIRKIVRKYADGLSKIEPGDLRKLKILMPKKLKGAIAEYVEIFDLYRSGNQKAASRRADAWVRR
jgi:hypothetical protein